MTEDVYLEIGMDMLQMSKKDNRKAELPYI